MGNTKSSGVTNMILYTYYLIRENTYLKEINLTNHKSEIWNIEKELVNIINVSAYRKDFSLNNYENSFHRCREWLIENHPELLL
jgi:hypothetical protein